MKKKIGLFLVSFFVMSFIFAYDEKAEFYLNYNENDFQSFSGTVYTNTTDEDVSVILQDFGYLYGNYYDELKKSAWLKVDKLDKKTISNLSNFIWLSDRPYEFGNNYIIFAALLSEDNRTVNALIQYKIVDEQFCFVRFIKL